ncbi:UNVERIFIED_CONTAM: hypothetical protein PYX00_002502 [Menopon gallinae]|uniref:Phosphatidate cytidylyltransferase, mitochondrial n=1 Tax=Menopon gallinae TaxID=328185 RepID=A0AAW2IIK5_9NEOP
MAVSQASVILSNRLRRIFSKFPQEQIKFSFAYGSGVYKQINNYNSKNMIDFIFVVDDAEKWHSSNLAMNPSHYSALSYLGSNCIAKLQTNFQARLYFNSMIRIKDENAVIKYGVITENDVVSDLLDWENLYIAGRLHKPVKILHQPSSSELKTALQLNLCSAVHAALLILPEYFTIIQFYQTITALSYNGDFRMIFGEDKNKVRNIVLGHKEKFKELYSPILTSMSDYVEIPENQNDCEINCNQDISPSAKHYHLNNLPRRVQRNLVKYWNKGLRARQDTEDVLRAMAFDKDCGEVLNIILSNIVWESSLKQSAKGILTAGVVTSFLYSMNKIGKMVTSKETATAKPTKI